MKHTGEAAATSSHSGLALILMVLVAAGILAPIAFGLRARWSARCELRRCPICNADAVRATSCHEVNVLVVRVVTQCGQCGTWRRLMRSPGEQRSHARRLKRDQRRIRRGITSSVRSPTRFRRPRSRARI